VFDFVGGGTFCGNSTLQVAVLYDISPCAGLGLGMIGTSVRRWASQRDGDAEGLGMVRGVREECCAEVW